MDAPLNISYDEATGISTDMHWDPVAEAALIETSQDVENIVRFNRTVFNDVDERAPWKKEGHGVHVAHIPDVMYWDLKAKGIIDDPKRLADWLNDTDNRFLRTRPGVV